MDSFLAWAAPGHDPGTPEGTRQDGLQDVEPTVKGDGGVGGHGGLAHQAQGGGLIRTLGGVLDQDGCEYLGGIADRRVGLEGFGGGSVVFEDVVETVDFSRSGNWTFFWK